MVPFFWITANGARTEPDMRAVHMRLVPARQLRREQPFPERHSLLRLLSHHAQDALPAAEPRPGHCRLSALARALCLLRLRMDWLHRCDAPLHAAAVARRRLRRADGLLLRDGPGQRRLHAPLHEGERRARLQHVGGNLHAGRGRAPLRGRAAQGGGARAQKITKLLPLEPAPAPRPSPSCCA